MCTLCIHEQGEITKQPDNITKKQDEREKKVFHFPTENRVCMHSREKAKFYANSVLTFDGRVRWHRHATRWSGFLHVDAAVHIDSGDTYEPTSIDRRQFTVLFFCQFSATAISCSIYGYICIANFSPGRQVSERRQLSVLSDPSSSSPPRSRSKTTTNCICREIDM